MPIDTIRFSSCSAYVKDGEKLTHYSHLPQSQFFEIFMPHFKDKKVIHDGSSADLCIISIQHTDNSLVKEGEKCLLISLENFSVGRKHYKHFNKFGRVNDRVNVYLYNDVAHPDTTLNIIPNAYMFVQYFNKIKDYKLYRNIREKTPFSEKKFCLFTSRNLLNPNKRVLVSNLQRLGVEVDFLDKYNDKIQNKSCYNSPELLEVYNQYKFIICFENSKTDGYITEKIFNVFLSGAVPIYDGPPNINDYIHKTAYIPFDENVLKTLVTVYNNHTLYNNYVNSPKTKELDYTKIDEIFKTLET